MKKSNELPKIRIDGTRFADIHGRTVILRGVNLGGDSKVPARPDESTHLYTDFSRHRDVSFVGRPFPLADAEEHFARLRVWGFNVIRLIVTWEAIEHAGPGEYDREYLGYLAGICRMAGQSGLYVFIDFHQDVWSRMSGGDGAPCWTFETAGIDYRNISASGAALVMQHARDFTDPNPAQKSYPPMCWSSNYRYPACAIMFTLFFGGMTFTPEFTVDGSNIQDYLQNRYLGALRAAAEAVSGCGNVIGFDPMNEPSRGWIGLPFSTRITENRDGIQPVPGLAFSPLDALMAARGIPVDVPRLGISLLRGRLVGKETVRVNAGRVPLWLAGMSDPFEEAGAWSPGAGGAPPRFNEDFFRPVNGRPVDFTRDHLAPFLARAGRTVRNVNPDWFVFVEKDAADAMLDPSLPQGLPEQSVNATHWYDGVTLVFKRFFPVNIDAASKKIAIGAKGIQNMYNRQIGAIAAASKNAGIPCLIGEFGIPFDMHGRRAYRKYRRGIRADRIWKRHVAALDLMYNAMDAALAGSTQWNYSAGNSNDPRIGDRWNQEDLSVFSRDQQDDPDDVNSGGRALAGFVRPYARRVQGKIISVRFARKTGTFALEFIADLSIKAPTEIFIPDIQYPAGFLVDAPGIKTGPAHDPQVVLFEVEKSGRMKIIIRQK